MAVDESLHRATDDLIQSPRPRRYYRAAIPNQHWQLRSLIGSPKQNIVYYPSGEDIIRLNTRTREREIITTLSFSPRCLVATSGWVCCGGDEGSYTSIFVGDKRMENETRADPDVRLPLDSNSARRVLRDDDASPTTPATRDSRLHYPLFPSVKSLGTKINNCITLWFPPRRPSRKIYQVPVSVVAKNDCTVSILNLNDSEIIETLDYPDYVNRAVMSPDGETLIAICDDPFLYIHKRDLPDNEAADEISASSYMWKLVRRIQLQGQKYDDASTMRGSFAAAFSRTGKYLAVATQYGVISVLDATLLARLDVDPLLAIFTTSRPTTHEGAVRAMDFSPGPFDLLAWTEASGRVGVADVRDLFLSRQLLIIDPHADGAERVLISDRPGEPIIDPRLRTFRTDYPSTTTTPDYLGLDFERRQLRSLTREMLDRQQPPLTEEEMEVLHAHRVARRNRDAARDSSSQSPSSRSDVQRYALPYTHASTATDSSTSALDRRTNTNLPTSLRDFVNTDRSAASFRAFIERQNRERERRSAPRRRDSMSTVLASLENTLERETAFTASRAAAEEQSPTSGTGLERLTLSQRGELPPRLPPLGTSSTLSNGEDGTSSPWAEIEALYRSRYLNDSVHYSSSPQTAAPNPFPDRGSRLRVEIEDNENSLFPTQREFARESARNRERDRDREREGERDFATRLRQPWTPPMGTEPSLAERQRESMLMGEENRVPSTRGLLSGVSGVSALLRARRGGGCETTGVAWSVDGAILYIGAEDGIYEYHVNVAARKLYPSVVMR